MSTSEIDKSSLYDDKTNMVEDDILTSSLEKYYQEYIKKYTRPDDEDMDPSS